MTDPTPLRRVFPSGSFEEATRIEEAPRRKTVGGPLLRISTGVGDVRDVAAAEALVRNGTLSVVRVSRSGNLSPRQDVAGVGTSQP